jgi:hypothetical protein
LRIQNLLSRDSPAALRLTKRSGISKGGLLRSRYRTPDDGLRGARGPRPGACGSSAISGLGATATPHFHFQECHVENGSPEEPARSAGQPRANPAGDHEPDHQRKPRPAENPAAATIATSEVRAHPGGRESDSHVRIQARLCAGRPLTAGNPCCISVSLMFSGSSWA